MGADSWLVEEALDTLEDVFYVYDERGRLVHWNAVLAELFDLSEAELSGMAAADFFVSADRPQVEAAIEEVLETGRTVVEARAETTRGTVLFELTGELLTDADDESLGFCGVGRDVTTVREREWQLARRNEHLGEFANVVAHDLRNPLQVAKLQLEAVNGDPDPETVARVVEALDRIEGIIEDVLTLAREGRTVLDRQPVELAGVARAAWDAVETTGASLEVRTDATVEADASRLQRLFENVFRNSAEHGPTGESGADGRCDGAGGLTVTVDDTETGFAIEDDGAGFPVDIVEEAFEAGVSGSASGTGLGLNIVRTLAEAHGWAVRVSEGTDGGARLDVDFESLYTDTASLDDWAGGRGE
ncbi:ATP-binding protein [Halorientalis regularis]|jgi:PAS domain S-box-containing protein|uniref:histidine kinase n=1 Tax=Halorientalis regularis TaxID=660518 RepID=A0A1G7FDW1_9EURY|nr:ATP-binding protein [Halorientalis regularis]SDE74089.1 PAS domain S-box-containing protein [Halorientalis regularis]